MGIRHSRKNERKNERKKQRNHEITLGIRHSRKNEQMKLSWVFAIQEFTRIAHWRLHCPLLIQFSSVQSHLFLIDQVSSFLSF